MYTVYKNTHTVDQKFGISKIFFFFYNSFLFKYTLKYTLI